MSRASDKNVSKGNRTQSRRVGLLSASFALGLALGGIAIRMLGRESTAMVQRTVAMTWGGGKYGPAFYGAWVYEQPVSGGLSTRARVWIGHESDDWHDCGELGRVSTHEEAVEKWGTITWKEDGLHIGRGAPNDYFLARAVLEAHR